MSDWIPIGEPDVPELSHDALTVQQYIQENDLHRITGKTLSCMGRALKMGVERMQDAIYEIRKKESIMGKGKLTNTQRAAIYQAYKDGVPQAQLAKQYNVTPASICELIKKLSQAESEMGIAPDAPAVNIAALEEKPMDKRPVAVLNEEFAAAVAEMEAQYKDANAEEKSAIAEESTAITEPEPEAQDNSEPLPPVVRRAVDGHLAYLDERIEALQFRISEIEQEIEEYRKDKDKLQAWKEQQKWR
ncbi:MAG: hypothetical protein J6P20_09945 [Oscillospiraceae bacterium]|nr:hypothetical protein [Oscillospiraceae bacterium]